MAEEQLALFVFSPLHFGKKGIKPSIFSHVYTRGRSVQRDTVASEQELVEFARNFLGSREDFVWKGVLSAGCDSVRQIALGLSSGRSLCVYDTAEKNNPAHAEICQAKYVIDEADRNELRAELFAAFNKGVIISPQFYRNGAVWNALPNELQSR